MDELGMRLLLTEGASLLPILRRTPVEAFDRPTVCTGWSVRDVAAHCASAMLWVASGAEHDFTPEANEKDVDERRKWDVEEVLAELEHAYATAAHTPAVASLALGMWVHGGDLREALDEPNAYASEGVEDAMVLLGRRAEQRGVPATDVRLIDAADHQLESELLRLGNTAGPARARVTTDVAGLFRLTGNRRPHLARAKLDGVTPDELRLFF